MRYLLALLVALLLGTPLSAQADVRLTNFRPNDGFHWFYDGWDKKETVDMKGSYQVIQAPATEKGGGGRVITRDLSKYQDHPIQIEARLGKENKADTFRVVIRDWDGTTGVWKFSTKNMPVRPKKFEKLVSDRPLGAPDEITHEGDDAAIDYENIDSWQIQGDYNSDARFHMEFKSLKLIRPKS